MVDRNLYSGLIRLHILHHAAEGPIFGQAMIDELGRHGYRLSAGTLYPILHGMERQGYLRSRLALNGGRNRRLYRATPCRPQGAGDRQAARAGTVRRNVRAPADGVAGSDDSCRADPRIVTLLCPALASAQGTRDAAAATAADEPDAGAGAAVRRRSLSDRASGARAGQRLDGQASASRKSAYLPRLDSLWQIEPRHRQQHLRPGAAAVRHPRDLGPGAAVGVRRQRLGQRRRRAVLVGAVRFRPSQRHGAPAPKRRSPARARPKKLTRLDVQNAVGAAFLAVVGAQRAVAAAAGRRRAPRRPRARGAHARRQPVAARAPRRRAPTPSAPPRRRALIQARQARDARRRSTLARVLGITTGPVAVDATTLLDDVRRRRRPPARRRRSIRWRRSDQAAVDLARAQRRRAGADRSAAAVSCSPASSRAAAARTRTAPFDGGADGLGLDRANWAAGVQVVFPEPVRLREPAGAARPRPPHRRARRRARYDEARADRDEPAAGGRRRWSRRRARSRANTPVQLAAAQQSEAQARARYEAGLASIVEVAEAQSLLAQAEYQDAARAGRRVAGAAGAGRRAGQPRRRFVDLVHRVRGSALDHVVDPRRAPPPDHGPRRGHRRRADGGVRGQPDARGHLSRSRSAGHLRRAAVRRHEPGADGGVHHLLLRVPLPLHQRHRERRVEVDPEHRAAEADVPPGHRHGRGAGADDRLRQSRARVHAARHRRPVHHAVRRRHRAGRLSRVLERDAAASARSRTWR